MKLNGACQTLFKTLCPYLTSPHLTLLVSPHIIPHHITSSHLTSPHLTSPHLTRLTSHNPTSIFEISLPAVFLIHEIKFVFRSHGQQPIKLYAIQAHIARLTSHNPTSHHPTSHRLTSHCSSHLT